MSAIIAATYALRLALTLWVQDPASARETPQVLPDIVVTEARAERVRRYVDALPEVNRSNEPLARFDRWICPGVVNMSDAHSQVIADRVSSAALAAGLRVGEPGCSPNVLVIFTADADRTVSELREAAPHVFDGIARTRRSGRTQLREFLQSDAPVRWWHSTEDVAANGGGDFGMLNLREPSALGEASAPKSMITGSVRSTTATRLSSASRMDITLALVIVDMSRIDVVDLNALGDYAAVVALGQIDPSADTSNSDTILNLFEPGSPIRAMSDLDSAYLRALYSARGDAARASQQKSEIVSNMLRELNPEPRP